MTRFVANMNNDFSALVDAPFEQGRDNRQFVWGKLGEQLVFAMRHAAIECSRPQSGFQQPVLAPLEGRIVVAENAEQLLISILQLYSHESPQQIKSVGMGKDERFAELRQLEQKLVE